MNFVIKTITANDMKQATDDDNIATLFYFITFYLRTLELAQES